MLLGLRVKNLALIEEAEIDFEEGLNILTGETGAGKSIVIGSIGLALGGKASRDMIRQGEDSAYIELVFSVTDEKKQEALQALSISPDEDGVLIISKRITQARSTSRINDETVTTAKLRAVTGLLLDMHGQHDHQSLLHRQKHLEILDEYSRSETEKRKEKVSEAYRRYVSLKERQKDFSMDADARQREADFTRFEIEEIESAKLRPGEEKELTEMFRRFSHSQKIMESMTAAYRAADSEPIGRALREVESAAAYDQSLAQIAESLSDAEAILNDVSRTISDYMNEMEFSEEEFMNTERRLDELHRMMLKYGSSEEAILETLEKKKERLSELENFEELEEKARKAAEAQEKELFRLCTELSEERRKAAAVLEKKIQNELIDLNFLHVDFRIEVRKTERLTEQGFDEVEFLISTNPGSIPPRPLGEVASGGELSRIMLAIKTVLADTDDIPTLIFDEIDTGISGRTAQKVSERLSYLASSHQVLCITHLPQIAAMADTHFEIRKTVENGAAVTKIHKLKAQEQIEELARLLGGAEITEKVKENAREMKRLAESRKH